MAVVPVAYHPEIRPFGRVEERARDRCVGCVLDLCDDWGYACVVVVVSKVEKAMFLEVCCFIAFHEIATASGILGERCLLRIDSHSTAEKEEA